MLEPNLGTPFLDVGQERARSRKPTALKSVLRLWSRFRAIDPETVLELLILCCCAAIAAISLKLAGAL